MALRWLHLWRAKRRFEQGYAAMSGVTVAALRAHGRIVVPCLNCDWPGCTGWKSVNAREYREDLRARRGDEDRMRFILARARARRGGRA